MQQRMQWQKVLDNGCDGSARRNPCMFLRDYEHVGRAYDANNTPALRPTGLEPGHLAHAVH